MPLLVLLLACGVMDALPGGARGNLPKPRAIKIDKDKAQRDGLELVTFKHQGVERSYYARIPRGAAPSGGWPMILGLHGGGTRSPTKGANIANFAFFKKAADVYGFIGLFPNGVGGSWWLPGEEPEGSTPDLEFLDAVIRDAGKRFKGNRSQVAMTGFSAGGHMTQQFSCRNPSKLVAAAPVGACLGKPLAERGCVNGAVPTLMVVGTDDPVNPFRGGTILSKEPKDHHAVLSAKQSMAFWAERNGCRTKGAPDTLADKGDALETRRTRWDGCSANTELVVVDGGTHSWPGGQGDQDGVKDYNATREILKFFANNGLRISVPEDG